MSTQYYVAASLDGFLADPSGSLDWLTRFDTAGGGDYQDFIRDVGALAMGATTYRWLLDNHVRPGAADGAPWPYEPPTWVFSTREQPVVPGADVRFARGDVRPVHADLVRAAAGRNVWIVGGGDLAGQFLDRGLLDELIVTLAPVTLGGGAPLLPRRVVDPPLALQSARAWGPGFVRLHYRVAPSA